MSEEKPLNGAAASPGPAEPLSPNPANMTDEEKMKRKNRMSSVKAEAIARLRSSDVPEGCGFQYDVSGGADDHDVEVVFKERTAL